MSALEVTIYAILAALVFLWGIIVLALEAVRRNKGERYTAVLKLLLWFGLPPVLGAIGFAAMMDPQGGAPVISTLRSICVGYIAGALIYIITKLARADRR